MKATAEQLAARQELRGYVVRLYGSQKAMADRLEVSQQTVSTWLRENPRGMLRYLPEIVKQCNTTAFQVMAEVMAMEEALGNGKP